MNHEVRLESGANVLNVSYCLLPAAVRKGKKTGLEREAEIEPILDGDCSLSSSERGA